jgi:hypothetical protein
MSPAIDRATLPFPWLWPAWARIWVFTSTARIGQSRQIALADPGPKSGSMTAAGGKWSAEGHVRREISHQHPSIVIASPSSRAAPGWFAR